MSMVNGSSLTRAGAKWRQLLIETLFPACCVVCGQEDQRWLCGDHQLPTAQRSHECPICRRPAVAPRCCVWCSAQSALTHLWVMASYESAPIRFLLQAIKYRYATEAHVALMPLICDYLAAAPDWPADVLLVPVPLHPRRYRWRGFNQAELLAQLVADVTGGQVVADLLQRRYNHAPQARLSRQERATNIRGGFVVDQRQAQTIDPDQHLVLVDDVYTTGATMQTCARALKDGGFARVSGLVVARGVARPGFTKRVRHATVGER